MPNNTILPNNQIDITFYLMHFGNLWPLKWREITLFAMFSIPPKDLWLHNQRIVNGCQGACFCLSTVLLFLASLIICVDLLQITTNK